jgi:hypothetical protein
LGIRSAVIVALGASAPGVVALVVRQSAVAIVAGVGLGGVASIAASAAVAALLFGVLSSYVVARAGLVVNPASVLCED